MKDHPVNPPGPRGPSPESEDAALAALLALATGYQRSQVLFTFVELEVPKFLSAGARTTEEIAGRIKVNPLAAERFLNACVAVGLLKKKGEEYSNTALSETFLTKSAEFFLGGQIKRYRERSYPLWADLTERLKSWKYGAPPSGAPAGDDQGAAAMSEQHNFSLLYGRALARDFDFSPYRKVLDLGGGTGATSIALCRHYPNLEAVVVDLPENAAAARELVAQSGLKERIECVGGDLQKEPLPAGFDVALLANFMSAAEAAENQKLLSRVYKNLPAGGACLLSGWIMDDSRLAPPLSVLFCLEDICWNAPDVERSEKVYAEWLAKAGFADIFCRTYLEPAKLLGGFKGTKGVSAS